LISASARLETVARFFFPTIREKSTTHAVGGVRMEMSPILSGTWRAIIGAIWAVTITTSAVGQGQRPTENRPDPRRGPWNSDLLIFTSRDGENFEGSKKFVERGGVPCVIHDAKNRLISVFQWFTFERREAFDKVAVVFSEDNGKTWTKPEPIVMEGLPEGAQRPFDPTLASLEDGKLRLYFTCTTRERREPGIYSAISEDGKTFRFEPGMRFGVDNEKVVDPAVTRLGKTWHLFSPMEPPVHEAKMTAAGEPGRNLARPGESAGGYHAISDDGLVFRRVDDAVVPVRGSWIGNVLAHGDQLHFYGSGAGAGWLARSADGKEWKLVSTALRVGGDPAPVRLGDDSFLIIATGPPRADGQRPPWMPAPSEPAERRPQLPRPPVPERRVL